MAGSFERLRTEEEQYRVLDAHSPDIEEALQNAPIFEKHVRVHARPAAPDERVVTMLASGEEETSNTAREGDWVVTNPQGEEYVVPKDEFEKKYAATENDGVYQSRGYCRAIRNPQGMAVEMKASWGELVHGDEQCFIVQACDADGSLYGEPYIVAKEAFDTTYLPLGSI